MKNYIFSLVCALYPLMVHSAFYMPRYLYEDHAEKHPEYEKPLPISSRTPQFNQPPSTICPFSSSFTDHITPSELGPTVQPPAGAGCIPVDYICIDGKYRNLDGTCNNLKHPTWGSANTRYGRLLHPRYSDGIKSLPTSVVDGGPLPLPRRISLDLFPEMIIDDINFTVATMSWGQLATHDMSLAMGTTPTENASIRCCDENFQVLPVSHPRCMHIIFPADDPFYSKYKVNCIGLLRTINDIDTGCNSGNRPAEQLVVVTHWMDLSLVYGNTRISNELIREGTGGRLKVVPKNHKPFPPRAFNVTDFCDLKTKDEPCYQFGDRRGNQNPQITSIQIMLLRDHNRNANLLSEINQHWDDERLFQEARSILIAKYQYISYYEFLPILLGYGNMLKYKLIYETNGHTYDYDENINPSVLNEHATAAFRLFHSAVQGHLQLIKERRSIAGTADLSDFFNRPVLLEKNDNLDNIMRGLATQSQEKVDQFITTELTHFLFKQNDTFGSDLKAVDILRDRDHALSSYNNFREFCGLPRAHRFRDFLDYISEENVRKLAFHYDHPDDVDLVVGGALEKLVPGTLAGPTYLCILLKQFFITRKSDRYFFEAGDQSGSFSLDQLREIRKASLARLLCDNGDDIRKMQPKAFLKISKDNSLTSCQNYDKIPVVNLNPWREFP